LRSRQKAGRKPVRRRRARVASDVVVRHQIDHQRQCGTDGGETEGDLAPAVAGEQRGHAALAHRGEQRAHGGGQSHEQPEVPRTKIVPGDISEGRVSEGSPHTHDELPRAEYGPALCRAEQHGAGHHQQHAQRQQSARAVVIEQRTARNGHQRKPGDVDRSQDADAGQVQSEGGRDVLTEHRVVGLRRGLENHEQRHAQPACPHQRGGPAGRFSVLVSELHLFLLVLRQEVEQALGQPPDPTDRVAATQCVSARRPSCAYCRRRPPQRMPRPQAEYNRGGPRT